MKAGDAVYYWAMAKSGLPTGEAIVEDGPLQFGGRRCFYVLKDNGRHDYVSADHLELKTKYQGKPPASRGF